MEPSPCAHTHTSRGQFARMDTSSPLCRTSPLGSRRTQPCLQSSPMGVPRTTHPRCHRWLWLLCQSEQHREIKYTFCLIRDSIRTHMLHLWNTGCILFLLLPHWSKPERHRGGDSVQFSWAQNQYHLIKTCPHERSRNRIPFKCMQVPTNNESLATHWEQTRTSNACTWAFMVFAFWGPSVVRAIKCQLSK